MENKSYTLAELTERVEAAELFVKDWMELFVSLHGDYDCTMTCSEAESAADLLRAFGRKEAAEAVMEHHTESDEPGDAHYAE